MHVPDITQQIHPGKTKAFSNVVSIDGSIILLHMMLPDYVALSILCFAQDVQ
jgi:hypothetical protein